MEKICIELKNGKKMFAEVYEDIAPKTVENFLKLVDEKFYDETIFHRVIKNFMCQAGGYYIKDKTVYEKEADSIIGEFESNGFKNDLKHSLGVLSMARTDEPNSASSQFFLCVDNCQHLDKNYAGFGMIIDDDSLEVLKTLNHCPTGYLGDYFTDFPNMDAENFTIKSIYRVK